MCTCLSLPQCFAGLSCVSRCKTQPQLHSCHGRSACPALPAQLGSLPACPVHHARTHLTTACAHPAHQCQSAPPPRLRMRHRPVTLRRPPLLALMLSTVVSALSASFRPLRVPSSVSLFPQPSLNAFGVPGAASRTSKWSAGPVCTTNTPCRSEPPCGKLSKTTSSALSPPTTRPNRERHQGSPCFSATGSRPWVAWVARAGSTLFGYRTARCSGRPSLSGVPRGALAGFALATAQRSPWMRQLPAIAVGVVVANCIGCMTLPLGVVTDRTNSWLDVSLLHAAAADLAPSALEAWRADPGNQLVGAGSPAAASALVAPQTLIPALARTTETAPAHAHHLPDLVTCIHDAVLPN